MGNYVSYFKSHGRRLLNRYNAQYRALVFLDKKKLPNAPRHHVPSEIGGRLKDTMASDDIHVKDLQLDKYLKDVYVKSFEKETKVLDESNSRPLPEVRDGDTAALSKLEEIKKGYCTLHEATKFLIEHTDDPEKHTVAEIAERYQLDEKKVESILKYYSPFTFQYDFKVSEMRHWYMGLDEFYEIQKEFKRKKEESQKKLIES